MQKKHKRIVLAGGHAGTTALATIQALKKSKGVSWELYWLGPQYAVEGSKMKTLEFRVFPDFGVRCIPLAAGRVQRKFTRYTIPSLVKIPLGMALAPFKLRGLRPDVILSFGGYAGFPVCFGGYLLNIPVILHEQTVAVGLANRASAWFAKKIAVAREDSFRYFPEERTVVTGNPILDGVSNLGVKEKKNKMPTVLFTGGSRGARRINKVVEEILPRLLLTYRVIHITGELDFDHFEELKKGLGIVLSKNYLAMPFVSPLEIHKLYEEADIVIGRAGANTVSEVLAIGQPSILIPIPWTRYDEQTKNAKFAESKGIARVITEAELDGELLLENIKSVDNNWSKIVSEYKRHYFGMDKDASVKLSQIVEQYVR